jgi:hypothetical protein
MRRCERVWAVNVKAPFSLTAAVYLASDEAAFVHGTILGVDGGRGSIAVYGAG